MALYDLMLRGGQVLVPASGLNATLDVAVAGGRIAALGPGLPANEARQVVDVRGLVVVPGLIDLHTHLGFELHRQVVWPNDVCPRSGVTTAVDMGSSGAFSFDWYRQRAIAPAQTRLVEFLNIASLGTIAIHTPYYVEHYGEYIDVEDTLRTVEANRAHIRGLKVFASGGMVGEWAVPALRAARQVADRAGVPVAVHVSEAPPALEEVLEHLGPGDIVTHSYTPHSQTILDARGQVRAAVRQARERGVLFDLGHGAGSFSFQVARQALEQGFAPDTLSTDLYYANIVSPVVDLPTTLSKFLNLGWSLEQAIAAATCNAARALRAPQLGTLAVGGPAEIAVLRLREGEFTFLDSLKQSLVGRWKLECELTVYDGAIIYRRGAQ